MLTGARCSGNDKNNKSEGCCRSKVSVTMCHTESHLIMTSMLWLDLESPKAIFKKLFSKTGGILIRTNF